MQGTIRVLIVLAMVATKANDKLFDTLLQAKPTSQASLAKLRREGLTLCLAGLGSELRMQES